MKNLFLTLAFVFATSISFAGNEKNIKVEAEAVRTCFEFTLSCGIGGTVCGTDLEHMIDTVMFVDDLLC